MGSYPPINTPEPLAPEPYETSEPLGFEPSDLTTIPQQHLWDDVDFNEKFMKWWKAQESYYCKLLSPIFQQMRAFYQRYAMDREDWRDENTEWRAFVTDPSPNQVIETLVQSAVEIFDTADTLVQAESYGGKTVAEADSIERQLDATLRKNGWNLIMDDLFRRVFIQGHQPLKIVYSKKSITIRRTIDESDWQDFEKIVKQAEMALQMPAPTADVDAFNQWRKMVSDVTEGKIQVPEIPMPGVTEQILYEGPRIFRPNVFTLRFDPSVVDWQEQPAIMQRFVVDRKYVEKLTDFTGCDMSQYEKKPWCTADPSKPFIGTQVEYALKEQANTSLSEWEKSIAKMLGYEKGEDVDPSMENPVELFECWMPSGDDVKKAFILNRCRPINKDPEYLEYEHGMAPWVNLRNIPVEGCVGMSEIKLSWSSFEEREKLRELFLDHAAIRGIPMFINLANSGLDEEEVQNWYPGKQFRPARVDALQAMKWGDNSALADLLRAVQFLRAEQDDTHATWGQVRGQEASVGRVTADESRNRLGRALLKDKARVARWSEELQPLVYQVLGLLAQYANTEDLVTTGGTNPFNAIPKQRFYDALFATFRLRGPLEHIDKIQTAEKLMTFGKTFGPFIRPEEMRRLMYITLRSMSIKEADEIVTQEGTAQTAAAFNQPPPGAQPPGGDINALLAAAGQQPPGGGPPGAPGQPSPGGPPQPQPPQGPPGGNGAA